MEDGKIERERESQKKVIEPRYIKQGKFMTI